MSSSDSVANNMYRYVVVRNHLEKLGYKYSVFPDSLPLIENLIQDLTVCEEELNQYKRVVNELEKEKYSLEKALEPYQQNNARLLMENNELKQKLFTEDKEQKKELEELKRSNREANHELNDLKFIYTYIIGRVKELEKELLEKNKPTVVVSGKKKIAVNTDGKKIGKLSDVSGSDRSKYLKVKNKKLENKLREFKAQVSDICVLNLVEVMDKRVKDVLEELEDLKLNNQHQSDIITALKHQVSQKDKEIDRLHHSLEKGQPLSVMSQDYCCHCRQKETRMKSLEEQLEAAVEKQHEAMSRALQLAERNQRLERELKDIDNMALEVEEECQNKVKQNLRNMDILQEKMQEKVDEIKKLEGTVLGLKTRLDRDSQELENLRTEKKLLEKNLNFAASEKKNLNDKINHFLLIEKNLKSEILRLQETNKSLQRQIGIMEERLMDVLGTNCKGQPRVKQKKHNPTLGLPICKTRSNAHISESPSKLQKENKKCAEDHCLNHCLHMSTSNSLLDKIQQERNFYHSQFHRLKEELGTLPVCSESNADLLRQIKSQEQEISDLKQEIFMLRRENSSLLKRFECSERLSCSSGDSIKIILDRLEKERDMALSDILRLQGERDALREKIKAAAESQLGEQSRLERIVIENEERIRRLESERRELISSQSSQRVALATVEEKFDECKEQTRKAQTDLAQMTANYNQLKTLQEQTDRSLSEVQGRLTQTDIESRVATTKVKELEKRNAELENEICVLKSEKCSLKSSLAFIEKEKDGLLITLDEKTEKVVKLESQIQKQEACISELHGKISHLGKKFEYTINEKTSREHGVRCLERTVEHLKEELQKCERQKEAFIRENRRLQDDLASAAKDCLTARKELGDGKEEVENLKRQLQQYVSEVKRAEELIAKKETERNQMLDHFRSLSLEATALESSNHTLESTVENTRTQLMSANNRIQDLEREADSKDSLLYGYEKQIAELTTQIAELEGKLKQQSEMKLRAEEDLFALRDLCSAIDGQKEALRRQANNHDAEKIQLVNEVRRLSEEYEGLNQKLTHERSLSQTLEKSLSNSRQETLEHKITNKDLQTQVQQLRQTVDELTHKLESESEDVRSYQAQCAELSQEVAQLRREVTNARFEQARALEDSRRSSYAPPPESEEDYPCTMASSLRSLPASSRTFTHSPAGGRRAPPPSEAHPSRSACSRRFPAFLNPLLYSPGDFGAGDVYDDA